MSSVALWGGQTCGLQSVVCPSPAWDDPSRLDHAHVCHRTDFLESHAQCLHIVIEKDGQVCPLWLYFTRVNPALNIAIVLGYAHLLYKVHVLSYVCMHFVVSDAEQHFIYWAKVSLITQDVRSGIGRNMPCAEGDSLHNIKYAQMKCGSLMSLSMHVCIHIDLSKFSSHQWVQTIKLNWACYDYDGNVRVPSKVWRVGKEDACSWDSGESNLKHQSHGGWERDSLIARKGQHLGEWK